jgi:hypothetical protein
VLYRAQASIAFAKNGPNVRVSLVDLPVGATAIYKDIDLGIIRLAPLADSFVQQLQIAIITPIVAALFGGVAVGLIVQYSQSRREFLTVRTALSVDMMEVAYSFYTRLIEVIRQDYYGQEVNGAKLPEQYENFRIAARVIEHKLHAYFSDGEARYMWHGVVDMLSVRYYRFTYGADSPRVIGMMDTHGQHPEEKERIPNCARELFPNRQELLNDAIVMDRFESMLNNAIYLVLHRKLDPSVRDDAILDPGRGSRLKPIASDNKAEGESATFN